MRNALDDYSESWDLDISRDKECAFRRTQGGFMYNMANALLRAAEKQDEELWQLIESGDLCALGRKIVDLAEQDLRAEVEEEIKL